MPIDFTPFQNPWGKGGKHYEKLPWVQQARQYGWDTGNDYYQPRTREEIRDEGIMQLAILAIVLAAPAIAGAASGGGGGAGAAGMGIGAEAPGVVAGQVAGGLGASGLAPLIAGAAGVAANHALEPYLRPNARQQISSKSRMGTFTLNEHFQSIAPDPSYSTPTFEWQPATIHPALHLLKEVFHQMNTNHGLRSQVIHEVQNGGGNTIHQMVSENLSKAEKWTNHPGSYPTSPPPKPSFEFKVEGQQPAQSVAELCPDDPKYAGSLNTGNLFDYDESSDEIAYSAYIAASSEEDKLDVIENYYQSLISIGRDDLGWSIAAKHLDYFLNGEPGPDGKLPDMIVDPQYLYQFRRVRDAMARTVHHIFHGSDKADQNQGLLFFSKSTSMGESRFETDIWEASVDYPGQPTLLGEIPNPDYWDGLSYSMGGFTLDAIHSTTLTRIDNRIVKFEGEITFVVEDKYDWHAGLSVGNQSGSIAIDDNWAQKLIDGGRANPFNMKSTIKVKYYGEIIDDQVYLPKFEQPCNEN